jgi:5'-methylthioadenosine phosphorylase
MGRLALATGTGTRGSELAGARIEVETRSGPVSLLDAGSHLVLQRHGLDRYAPPHLIDHVAHFEALASLGCDRVLAVSSVGSLRSDLPIGSALSPDDFIALHLGLTSRDDERGHAIAGFDPEWRRDVIGAWNAPVADGGTYWQAVGPRLETPAEIRMVAAHADVIGMTVASECIVAAEMGMAYAAVCTVDNLANGLDEAGRPLDVEELAGTVDAGRPALLAAIDSAVAELAA